jgi:hypothetical protein
MRYFKIFIIVFSFFAVSTSYSQKNATKDDLKLLRFELIDSLSKVKSELVKTKKASLIQKEILTKKLEDSSNTISYLNSVVDSFSGLITFLGIFIAILALVIPFATYEYAVKPSREVLKDLEKSFDERLERYLWENRNNQINQAIENIKGGTTEEKSQAISYLTFTQSEGLTDNQLFQIYIILKRNQSDYNIKSQLAYILSTRKTDYATELFNNSQINNDPIIRQMAIIYYAKIGFKSNYEGLTHIIGNEVNQDMNFITFIANLNQYNSSDIDEVLNDKIIVDLLTIDTLKKLKISFPTFISSQNSDTNYNDSYLAEKIKSNS